MGAMLRVLSAILLACLGPCALAQTTTLHCAGLIKYDKSDPREQPSLKEFSVQLAGDGFAAVINGEWGCFADMALDGFDPPVCAGALKLEKRGAQLIWTDVRSNTKHSVTTSMVLDRATGAMTVDTSFMLLQHTPPQMFFSEARFRCQRVELQF